MPEGDQAHEVRSVQGDEAAEGLRLLRKWEEQARPLPHVPVSDLRRLRRCSPEASDPAKQAKG
jgi:hypothetical protein